MKNKYFFFWLLIIGIPLAICFVVIMVFTGDGGIISGLFSSLILSVPTAFVLSMFHKWYREVRQEKHIVGVNGRRIFTEVEIRRIGTLRQILFALDWLFMLYYPVGFVFYGLLGIIKHTDYFEYLGWILMGAIYHIVIGIIAYIVIYIFFFTLEKYYGFKIPTHTKFPRA